MIQCSSCHPEVGTGLIKHVCNRTCNSWYKACSVEFFSSSTSVGGALTPCLEHHMICSKLDTFVKNGPEFCTAMGFEHEPNIPSLEPIDDLDTSEQSVNGDSSIGGVKCFDGTIPDTEGVPERRRTTNGRKNDPLKNLFKKYRKTRAGKAAIKYADRFVNMVDGIPTWLMVGGSLLIGALLAGRIMFSGDAARRLGRGDDNDSN
jgi:hypothetical protein